MTPSVVATDLDGTLVHKDGTISARTRSALSRAHAAGALVVVATGRPPRWLPDVAEATGHHGLAICANGAQVYDLAAGQVIRSRPLSPDVVRRLVGELRVAVPGIEFGLEFADGGFAHEPGYRPRWTPKPGARIGTVEDLLDQPVSKLLGRRDDLSSDELLGIARSGLDGSIATFTHSSIDGLLEISALGVTKASTLEVLVRERGLGPEDVIAFGDMPNDVEMLRWAGHGVAVANAHPKVLAVADEVTGSNDEDGVAAVLERLFP